MATVRFPIRERSSHRRSDQKEIYDMRIANELAYLHLGHRRLIHEQSLFKYARSSAFARLPRHALSSLPKPMLSSPAHSTLP